MAVLIPALGSCAGRMTQGEKRLAQRLQQKLEDGYWLWWDVPIGPRQTRPDFVLVHPRRGALILETRDWPLETIRKSTREYFEILEVGTSRAKVVMSPLQQARHCAIQVVSALECDPLLVAGDGPHQGKLSFPWGHGVVLTRITRKQFDDAGLGHSLPGHLVICQDEMLENVDPEMFQQRLWNMFPQRLGPAIDWPELDRIRWILFSEMRVPQKQNLLDDRVRNEGELPDLMRVMDLPQEQLARSLGDGHRVIHGVAGSGKTMILGYRAEYLARTQGPDAKPILVLCYSEPLGVKLAADIEAKGLQERVHVRHFHQWCREQLAAHEQLPADVSGRPQGQLMEEYGRRVIQGVDDKRIPTGQYHAILIDEGHDFAPEWLKLVTQMVDPSTDSLLLLYDDAQSIYDRGQKRHFSLKSVGIHAAGRTTILKINYRNTRQVLQLAHRVAGDMLRPEEAQDEDSIPLLKPLSCGREGPEPIVIDLPTLPERAARVAELLADQHALGHAWGEMAVLCRHKDELWVCSDALRRKGLPHRVRDRSGDFQPEHDSIKLMTMHASKGLEWPVVAVVTSDAERKAKNAKKDGVMEAKLVYVASTRANRLLYLST